MGAGADFGKAAGMEKFLIGMDKSAYANAAAGNSERAEKFAFQRRLPHIRTAVKMAGGSMEEPEDGNAVAVVAHVPKKEDMDKIQRSVVGIKVYTDEDLYQQGKFFRDIFREAFATEEPDTQARIARASVSIMQAASRRGA